MRNVEIVWSLMEIADLLEFKGEDFFKIRAYRRAARVLAGLPGSVEEMYKDGSLKNVPGVGKNIMAKIGELLETGECSLLKRLREEVPPGVLQIMAIPGMGPKRAKIFYEKLNITNLEELEEAARNRKIRSLPGMGGKREMEILQNIKMLQEKSGRFLLSFSRELAGEFLAILQQLPEVREVTVTGSLRRWQEMVHDIDILVVSEEPQKVVAAFDKHPLVNEVLYRDRQRVKLMSRWGIPVEIFTVPREAFIPSLVWTTGSAGHWRGLQKTAARRGMQLDKDALYDREGNPVPVQSEEELYSRLGLAYIPPEMREDGGEITLAAAGNLPKLVDRAQIKGDLHVHTSWSDGGNSIEELVDRARKKGYTYLAVTDHSRSLKIARGLSIERLKEQQEYIARLNRELEGFRILSGIEVDILSDGSLDYPDEILAEMDIVIASVHSAFKQDRDKMTQRIISAIENPHVDVIGHLTGRLLGYREGYEVDVEKVIQKAAENNTALEINSSPDRLDLNMESARRAREMGVKMTIGTDAHDLRRLDEMDYGLAVARRAWLEPGDVLNTMEIQHLLEFLGRDDAEGK